MNTPMTRLALVFVGAVFGACSVSHRPTDGGMDVAATDGDGGGRCPHIEFISPEADAVLGPAQDVDNSCDNGFQTDVRVATDAPEGTQLELLVNGVRRATATVAGPTVTFRGVELDTRGTARFQVRPMGASMACGPSHSVTVNCNTPTCSITTPTETTLNLSHNVSSEPGRFAARFVVSTDIEDGQPVTLNVSTYGELRAVANGGQAEFPSVPLRPDGTHSVRARCVNRAGTVGLSAETTYTVDSVPPSLTIVSPMPGSVIRFSDPDVDPMAEGKQFRVCARSDAAGQELVGNIEMSAPGPGGRAIVPTNPMEDVCVQITCPSGSAPFNVELSVSDAAGNRARATLANISCASDLPSVRIVDPVASVMGDRTTYLNAARDEDRTRPGLQYTVIACSDRMTGTAELSINGARAGMPVSLEAAAMGSACAMAGFRSVARFVGVTLPESFPPMRSATDPFPTNPSLVVRVTDPAGDVGSSPSVNVFVDSTPPVLSLRFPVCGSILRPGMDGNARTRIAVGTDVLPVTVILQREMDTPRMLTGTAYSVADQVNFDDVALSEGRWTLRVTATDPAGNTGSTPETCQVMVGNPPQVTFTNPRSGQTFSATGDADRAMPGYQSVTVTLSTDAPDGSPVELVVGSDTVMMGTVMSGGASFGPLTLPEGDAVTLRATVRDAVRGEGTASITVRVDTQPPSAPSGLSTMVVSRRGGRIRLTWTGAGDPNPAGGTDRAVHTYEVRWSTSAINEMNFASATPVSYPATPGAPGSSESAETSGLQLGVAGSRTYYFAVRARDAAGNVGPVVATTTGTPLDVLVDTITDTAAQIGNDLSGGHDVDGDGIPDVVVGTTNDSGRARIYFGTASGLSSSRSVDLSGLSVGSFGRAVASLGDFNGDGLGDVAVAAPGLNAGEAGAVYVFLGRRSWPSGLSINDADVEVRGTWGTMSPFEMLRLVSLARADFDGDGLMDLVIGAPLSSNGSSSNVGAVAVVRGRSVTRRTTLTLPNDADVLIRGNTTNSGFGRVVAFGGALTNDDMRDEILVGESDATSMFAGAVYVFAGRSIGGSRLTLTPADADFRDTGTTANALQMRVSSVGDINGDGRLDFVVGALNNSLLTLYLGNGAGSFVRGDTIRSSTSTDRFGISAASISRRLSVRNSLLVSSSSDPSDLIVGSALWMSGDPRIALFRGRSSWAGISASSAEAYVSVSRTRTTATPITALQWAGDLDRDGYEDVIGLQSDESRIIWLH